MCGSAPLHVAATFAKLLRSPTRIAVAAAVAVAAVAAAVTAVVADAAEGSHQTTHRYASSL